MKKMCYRYIKPEFVDGINTARICGNKLINPTTCPKNTNYRCQIVSKPKPKYKTIKGWASIRYGKVWCAGVRKWSSTKKLYPCTITIEAKYLKGAK